MAHVRRPELDQQKRIHRIENDFATDTGAMRLAGLRQHDGVTCGPSVAVVAGALLDPGRRSVLSEPDSRQAWFAAEQLRVHAEVNRIWPRRLGTTPMGMAHALTVHSSRLGVRYG